jgi:hypothetical protein
MTSKPLARRSISLFLVLLVGFLSYRPTTAILSLAGCARNPSDGGRLGQGSEIDGRENKPRPAKAQQREPRRRIAEETRRSDARGAGERSVLALLRLSVPQEFAPHASGSASKVKREISKPQYLQLFLPATPGNPHSPPA